MPHPTRINVCDDTGNALVAMTMTIAIKVTIARMTSPFRDFEKHSGAEYRPREKAGQRAVTRLSGLFVTALSPAPWT
jgi:hypothetical protein